MRVLHSARNRCWQEIQGVAIAPIPPVSEYRNGSASAFAKKGWSWCAAWSCRAQTTQASSRISRINEQIGNTKCSKTSDLHGQAYLGGGMLQEDQDLLDAAVCDVARWAFFPFALDGHPSNWMRDIENLRKHLLHVVLVCLFT